MNKRIKYIDITKCIAIFMIVLGHTLNHSIHLKLLGKFLYSFHVFLFFILSGYTFSIKNKENFKAFFKKKFVRIMIPYFIWAIFFLLPYMLLGNKVGESLGTSSSFDLKNQIINIIYGNGNASALKQNSSLWFLPALFSMECFYYFIIKNFDKKNKRIYNLLILIFIGYITSNFLNFYLPWGINTVLNIGFFFYIGYLFKESNIEKNTIFNWNSILVLTFFGIIGCYFNKIDVAYIDYQYGYYSLAILSGICLSLLTLFVSIKIDKNKIMEYIGKNTMGILIFHKLVVLVFQTKLGFISRLITDSNFFIEMILCILVALFSIICSLIGTVIVRRLFPLSIGENKK